MIGYLTSNYSLIHAFGKPAPVRRTRRDTIAANRVFKLAPKLSDYVRDEEIVALKGSLERPISGLGIDSRRVVPGTLFFALPGLRADGATFIDEAISRGAVAIVTQTMPAITPSKVTFIQVADSRAALAKIAQRFYKFPDRDMTVAGVTGTSGKTCVTHLLQHLLGDEQQRVGMLGTVSYDLGSRTVPSFQTTPEALDVFGMMAQMRDAGCRKAVIEVSSHGIDQQRVDGLQFGAAIFTNLTHDHLDYHVSLENEFEVKSRLFTGQTGALPKVSVVNVDDSFGVRLADKVRVLVSSGATTRLVTFGESVAADVRAEDVRLHATHTSFRLVWPGGARELVAPVIGRGQLSNLLAAIAAAWSLGRDPIVFLARLRTFKGVPGRMERIETGQPFNVVVDYAHTEDALRNALSTLKPITSGRLLMVFGCGGNRDRAKRPLMAGAVEQQADVVFATADNPRGEALAQIFEDMRGGVTAPGKFMWIDDRRRAINLALEMAKPGDCVLIAGKGHESFQELAGTVMPFDDRQVARELLETRAQRWQM
jgi:UDP-N-acetylmuramoyl-L-alanyl-D-glutamate--2,6-diaminopimelate ligase